MFNLVNNLATILIQCTEVYGRSHVELRGAGFNGARMSGMINGRLEKM